MVNFEKFFNQLLNDVRISITEEFDRNFERKAFFDKKWPDAKYPAKRGSLMMRTGALRRSILSRIQGETVVFTSSEAYAAIHNEGGTITVTAKMKKFFWAMYYQASGGIEKTKSGQVRKSNKNNGLQLEAEYWKSMALIKVGTKIKVPERRFIGQHPAIDQEMQRIAHQNIAALEDEINRMLMAQGMGVRNIRFR